MAVQSVTHAKDIVEQGEFYYKTGQFQEAVDRLTHAVQIFSIRGQKRSQAITSGNLSLAYLQLGDWTKAEEAIATSLDILGFKADFKELDSRTVPDLEREDLQILGSVLNIYGRLLYSQSQPESALYIWRLTANIYQQLGDNTVLLVGSKINQAQALQTLGRYQLAKNTIESVQENIEKLPSPLKIKAKRSLGDVLRALGDLQQSQCELENSLNIKVDREQCKEDSFSIELEQVSSQDISATLLSLGNTFRALGNLERERQAPTKYDYEYFPSTSKIDVQAKEYYDRAVDIYKCVVIYQAGDTPIEKKCISRDNIAAEDLEREYDRALNGNLSSRIKLQAKLNLLNLFLEMEEWQAAEEVSGAIELSNLPASRTKIYAEINLAKNLAYLQVHNNVLDWKNIINRMETAGKEAEELKDNRAESYAFGNLGGFYEYLGQHQQEIAPSNWLDEAKGRTDDALYLSQLSNAPDITYQWQWQLGRLLETQGKREDAIGAYIAAAETLKLVRKDLLVITSDVQFSFRDQVEPVYRKLVDLLLQTKGNNKVSQQYLKLAIKNIDAIQLGELENFLGCDLAEISEEDRKSEERDRTAAFIYPIILQDRLEIILKLPDGDILQYTTDLSDKITHQRFEATINDLPRQLNSRYLSRAYLGLSQNLYHWLIPPEMEAQLADAKKHNGLKTLVFILDGQLRNIPMSVLYHRDRYLIEDYAIAVITSEKLLKPRSNQSNRSAGLIGGLTKQSPSLDLKEVPKDWSKLPHAEAELNQIAIEIRTKKDIRDNKFTKNKIQDELKLSYFPVIHFVTHGQFSSDPEETFILGWKELFKVKQLNELFQNRVSNQPQPIELLVLSACQTAQGDKRAALGLAGIAVRAGARSTLATLWKVDDLATSDFMVEFYKELIDNQSTKTEALRKTQIKFLNSPDYQHPKFWAAFVVVGDWQ